MLGVSRTTSREGKIVYAITERLRQELETARSQHGHTLMRSREAGHSTELYVRLGKRAEYHRGKADGIRLALDAIADGMRSEAENSNLCKLRKLFALCK